MANSTPHLVSFGVLLFVLSALWQGELHRIENEKVQPLSSGIFLYHIKPLEINENELYETVLDAFQKQLPSIMTVCLNTSSPRCLINQLAVLPFELFIRKNTSLSKTQVQQIPSSVMQLPFIETSFLFEEIISPLLSAYIIDGWQEALVAANKLTSWAVNLFTTAIPPPFIINEKPGGLFDSTLSSIGDVSSVFPILAALSRISYNPQYEKYIESFITTITPFNYTVYDYTKGKGSGNSTAIPLYQLQKNLYRVKQLLPTFDIQESLFLNSINKKAPLKIKDAYKMEGITIEACGIAPYINRSSALFKSIQKECTPGKGYSTKPKLIKNAGNGKLTIDSSFDYSTELLDIYWINDSYKEGQKYFESMLNKTWNDSFYSEIARVDPLLRIPQPSTKVVSRWLVSGLLMASHSSFIEFTRNDIGHVIGVRDQ